MSIFSNSNFVCNLKKSIIERIIFCSSLLIILVFIYLYMYFPDTYLRCSLEDKMVENTQALTFLFSSIVGFLSIWRVRKSEYKNIFWLLLIFAVGCLFLFLEEISWGQRLLDIETPNIFLKHNLQHETNIHNLDFVQRKVSWAYVIIGIYGGMGWIFIRNSSLKAADLRRFIIPEWYCSLYFLPRGFFNIYYYFIKAPEKTFFIWPQIDMRLHQEPLELLVALGFLLVALGNYRKATKLLQ